MEGRGLKRSLSTFGSVLNTLCVFCDPPKSTQEPFEPHACSSIQRHFVPHEKTTPDGVVFLELEFGGAGRGLCVGDGVGVDFVRTQDVALAIDVFRVAEEDVAVVIQQAGEVADDFFLADFIEVNQDVAAEDDVEFTKGLRANGVHQVAFHEAAHLLDFGLEGPAFGADVGGAGAGRVLEVQVQQGRWHVADIVFTVDTGAGFFQSVVADVRADQFEGDVLADEAHVLEHQGNGVEFVPRAGGGGEDAETHLALGAAGEDQGHEDFIPEGLQLRFVAEEEGFVDGDFVNQEAVFGAARGAFQIGVVGFETLEAESLDAEVDFRGDEIGFVEFKAHAGELVDERGEFVEQRFGQLRAIGGHGARCLWCG